MASHSSTSHSVHIIGGHGTKVSHRAYIKNTVMTMSVVHQIESYEKSVKLSLPSNKTCSVRLDAAPLLRASFSSSSMAERLAINPSSTKFSIAGCFFIVTVSEDKACRLARDWRSDAPTRAPTGIYNAPFSPPC